MNKEIGEIKERLKKKYMKLYTDYSEQLYSTEAKPEKYYAFDKDQVFIDIRHLLSSLEGANKEIERLEGKREEVKKLIAELEVTTTLEFSNLQTSLEKEEQAHVMSRYDLNMKIAEVGIALEKEREAHESCIKTADLLREMISGLQVALIEEKERVDKVEHENRIMRIGVANQLRILHECLDILSPLDQIGEPNTLLSLVKKSMERVKELETEITNYWSPNLTNANIKWREAEERANKVEREAKVWEEIKVAEKKILIKEIEEHTKTRKRVKELLEAGTELIKDNVIQFHISKTNQYKRLKKVLEEVSK